MLSSVGTSHTTPIEERSEETEQTRDDPVTTYLLNRYISIHNCLIPADGPKHI